MHESLMTRLLRAVKWRVNAKTLSFQCNCVRLLTPCSQSTRLEADWKEIGKLIKGITFVCAGLDKTNNKTRNIKTNPMPGKDKYLEKRTRRFRSQTPEKRGRNRDLTPEAANARRYSVLHHAIKTRNDHIVFECVPVRSCGFSRMQNMNANFRTLGTLGVGFEPAWCLDLSRM